MSTFCAGILQPQYIIVYSMILLHDIHIHSHVDAGPKAWYSEWHPFHNVGWEENNVKDGGWDGMMEDFRDMRQATNTND
jgi:hypothetical protein